MSQPIRQLRSRWLASPHGVIWAALGLTVISLAVLLRLHRLADAPLWTDELFSLQSSWGRGFYVETLPRETVLDPAPDPTSVAGAGPLLDIYATQKTDTHPPLYFMLLRVFRSSFGDEVLVIRLPSVLASLAAVGLLGWAVGICAGRAAGVTAAVLATVAVPQVIFAQEARGYMLANAAVLGSAVALVKIERVGISLPRLTGWVLLPVVAVSTLYLASLPLLALGLYALLHLRGPSRWAVLGGGLVSAVIAALLLGPLLSSQLEHLAHRNRWLVSDTPREATAVMTELSRAAVLGAVAGELAPRSAVVAIAAAAVTALLALAAYGRTPAARPWVWMSLGLLLPLAVWDVLADKTHLQQSRYVFLASAPLLALLACLPSALGRLAWLIPIGAVAFAGVSLPEAYRSTKEEWQLVRDFAANGRARATDLFIIAAHGGRDWEHILYLGLSRYLREAWGRDRRLAMALHTDPAADRTLLRRDAERRGGVVVFAEPGTPVDGLVPDGWVRTALQNVPSVGVLQTFRPSNPAPTSTASATAQGKACPSERQARQAGRLSPPATGAVSTLPGGFPFLVPCDGWSPVCREPAVLSRLQVRPWPDRF